MHLTNPAASGHVDGEGATGDMDVVDGDTEVHVVTRPRPERLVRHRQSGVGGGSECQA